MGLQQVGAGQLLGSGISGDVPFIITPDLVELTTSATLTAAQIQIGRFRCDQGAAGAATYTLPTGLAMDDQLANIPVGGTFFISFTNVGNDSAEDVTIAAGVGFTIIGSDVIQNGAAALNKSAAIFEVRKTGVGTWTLRRAA